MKNFLILMLCIFLLSSCASALKVEVQVADRDKIIEKDSSYTKEKDFEGSIKGLQKFIKEWPSKEVLSSIYSFTRNNMGASLDTNLEKAYENALTIKLAEIENLKDDAISSYLKNDTESTKIYLNTANFKIQDLEIILSYYNILLPENIRQNRDIQKISYSISTTKETIETGTERSRFPILGDELASFIAKNKDNKKLWKSVFNKTVSGNFLGNSDIAMILRSNPPEREMRSGDYNNNFTIKGVRNDTADASNALITGLTQTLNFIANTQGIPTNITTTSVDNPVPVENPLVTGMTADTRKLALKKEKLKNYRKMLIDKILLENVSSGTTDAEVQASAKRISDHWEALKTELNKP